MDIKEAYKELGVSETATAEEIEKQYMIWVKRNHAIKNQPEAEKEFDIDTITTAYNTIKHFNEYGSNPTEKERSLRDKFQHFFHYYKLHIIGFIVLLVLVGSLAQNMIQNHQEKKELASLPPENLSILLYGDYFDFNSAATPVSENILEKFPSWERVSVNMNYSPVEINDSMDTSMQQKSAVTLFSDKSDVYIMDAANFEQLMKLDMFVPLEQLEPSLKEQIESENLIYAKNTEDKTEQIYGVVLQDPSIFDGLPVKDAKKIAAVRVDSKNKNYAIQFILENGK